MTNFLNHYTIDKNRPLDPATRNVLSIVNSVANELRCPYILVGATARDLLLFHVFGIPVTRATLDIDFALAVDSWERFHQLRNGLLATGNFDEGKVQHRIFLKAANASDRIPIDLIPFGAVAEADMISWPPNQDTVMTVAGFEDALAAAVRVQIDPDLTVTVASLAGIAVLKLFACHERSTTDKDALDLYRIISTYADAGNIERLYEEAIDLLEAEGHDVELAGATLLGSDARRLCSPATMLKLRELFAQTDFAEKMAERVRVSRFPLEPERLGRIHQLMSKFTERLIG